MLSFSHIILAYLFSSDGGEVHVRLQTARHSRPCFWAGAYTFILIS